MIFCTLFFVVQQYKYRDLTVREITNVISQYKDLKPVMDAYGKKNPQKPLNLFSSFWMAIIGFQFSLEAAAEWYI